MRRPTWDDICNLCLNHNFVGRVRCARPLPRRPGVPRGEQPVVMRACVTACYRPNRPPPAPPAPGCRSAPPLSLSNMRRQPRATAARGTAGGGVRGGLGAQERVGGSCEIGGRLWGRLDHPPPPPSARSCLLAGAKDVKLGARSVKMSQGHTRCVSCLYGVCKA